MNDERDGDCGGGRVFGGSHECRGRRRIVCHCAGADLGRYSIGGGEHVEHNRALSRQHRQRLGVPEDTANCFGNTALGALSHHAVRGFAGALLLLFTPSAAFDRIVPWLLAAGALAFAFAPAIGARL
jgi:hypothetical protein